MINILLIDHALDEPKSVRCLLPELQTNQFTIDSATDDASILAALSRNDFDVCLIDSILGDGLTLVGRLSKLGRKMPIILVTSNNAGEVLAATRNGVADCLIRDELTSAGLECSVWSVVDQDRAVALQDQHERRYLALFDYSDATIFTCDLYGKFTSINRAGERLMGFTEEEALRQNLFELVAPEYLVVVLKVIQQAIEAQRGITSELVLITKETDTLLVEICAHPVCRYGRSIELQVIARIIEKETSRLQMTQATHVVGIELKDRTDSTNKNLAA